MFIRVRQNIVAIPKTVTESRLKENIDIFDFELSGEDMNAIKALNQEKAFSEHHHTPETAEKLISLVKNL